MERKVALVVVFFLIFLMGYLIGSFLSSGSTTIMGGEIEGVLGGLCMGYGYSGLAEVVLSVEGFKVRCVPWHMNSS